MGLQDREWFHQDRNKQKKPQKKNQQPERRNTRRGSWEPSWALVIVLLCAAAGAAYWL